MKIITIVILLVSVAYAGNAQNRYADSIRSVLANTTQPLEQFDLLNKIVEDIFTNGSGNIDYSSCVEMVRIAQQLNNDSLLAIAYNNAGNYFLLNNGDYSKALEYFFKGIPKAENAKDKRRLSSLYIDIAVVYYRLNNPDEQIKYLRKAIDNLPDPGSPLYYFNYDSAFYYTSAFSETNRYLKSPVYACASQSLVGIIYEKTGDTTRADLHYRNSIRGADSVNYSYIKLSVKIPYISFLIKTNKITEATDQARQLMQMGIGKNNSDIKRTAAGFLRKIAEHNNNTDSAYYYSQLESALKDSVFNQNSINKIQSLVFSEQLRVIEEEGKRAEEEAKRRSNIQYALIALGIITFLILFLVLSHNFMINERLIHFLIVIALLIVFEFLNLLLHPFLEGITHHNPILMLLALVCIAALLVPLHHRLEKWAAHKLVEKNKLIRLAVAKKMKPKTEGNNS